MLKLPLMKGQFRNFWFFLGAAILLIVGCIKGFSFGETIHLDFFIDLHKGEIVREYDDLIRIEQEWVNEAADKLEREQERESNTIKEE